jgi:small nuclear ribonucleoprotein (snRNP)-like protein
MKRRREEMAPNSASNASINLGKPSLRIRLEAYYSLIAPDVIANQTEWRAKFDQIYQKFGGSYEGEKKLGVKLAKKYGTTIRLLLAESASSAASDPQGRQQRSSIPTTTPAAISSIAPGESNITIQEDQWYTLLPQERDSGIVDFLSDCFDPFVALAAPESQVTHINPWIDECPLLDNVGKFLAHLPENDPLRRLNASNHKRQSMTAVAPPETTSQKPKSSSTFTVMAEEYEKGPLSVLYRLQNHRIRVLVRYVNAIRGTVTGVLLAFDKHMNMILRDVEEVYTPRPVTRGSNSKDEELTGMEPESNLELELKRRQNALRECLAREGGQPRQSNSHSQSRLQPEVHQQWCVRQRTMKQIMVRGDTVVLVYKAETERSTWPKTAKSPLKSRYNRPIETVPDDDRVGSPGSLIYALQRKQRRDDARKRPSSGSMGGSTKMNKI